MRVASISVGIVAYSDPRLATNAARLQFAVDDARAFHRYAKAAWAQQEHIHLLLTDGGASLATLSNAFEQVAVAGGFDLFLLYLSGHGETNDGRGWFCLVDAASGSPSLTVSELDALLAQVTAERVLVVSDYCFAEASFAGTDFFASLGSSLAKLYIASARRTQQAWEDDTLKRSILSDILLKALSSTSSLADRDGTVEVETRLIPYLREQVPLEAASRKRGAAQEPVAGGTAVAGVRLPTVAASDIQRPLTITEALRARLRRILVVSAVILVASWAVLDLLVYHLAVNSAGAIMVRPGIASLHELAPFHLGPEVDTGFSVADLSRTDREAFRRLTRGSERGFSTRKDRDRLADWLGRLQPALTPAKRAETAMLVRARALRLEQSSPPSANEAAFVALATRTDRRVAADRLYPVPEPAGITCGRPVALQIDFGLLDVPQRVFARDLAWRGLRIDGPRYSDELAEMVKVATYRALSSDSAAAVAPDTEALAIAAAQVGAPGRHKLPRLNGWCEGPGAVLVRALLGNRQERMGAEAALAADLPKGTRAPGADWPRRQTLAIAALSALSTRVRLQPETVAAIVNSFANSGEALGSETELSDLLSRTAAHQPLPVPFREKLLQLTSKQPDDLEGVTALALVARNARHLSRLEVQALRRWMDAHGAENRTISEVHEALGNLSLVAPLRPREINWLTDRLSPYSWLSPMTTSLRGEIVITASDAEAAVALAKVGMRQPLARDVVDRLRTIAASRADIKDRATLLIALAAESGVYDVTIEDATLRAVRKAKSSAFKRQFAIDTSVAELQTSGAPAREKALAKLLIRWSKSRAPEERHALGKIIGAALLPTDRVRVP